MTGSVDKLTGQNEMRASNPFSAAPRDDTGGKTPENLNVLRDIFWESALESSSLLAWIAAHTARPDCPFL